MSVDKVGGAQQQLPEDDRDVLEDATLMANWIGETLESLLERLAQSGQAAVLAISEKIFSGKVSIIEALGLEPEQIEGVYGMAVRFYEGGEYEQAEKFFKLLMMLDPEDVRYQLGLAACRMMQEEYGDAISVYIMAAVIDPDNPEIPLRRAECNCKREEWIPAGKALEKALELMGDDEKYTLLRERAQVLLDSIKDKIKEDDPMRYEVDHELAMAAGQKIFENDTMRSAIFGNEKTETGNTEPDTAKGESVTAKDDIEDER